MIDKDELLNDRIEEVELLINTIPDRPESSNANLIDSLSRAAVVLLCSHFEGSIQDMMTLCIGELNNFKLNYKDLDIQMRVKNDVFHELKHISFEKLCTIIHNLEENIKDNKTIKLDKTKFNKTESNPSPDLINGIFKVLGFNSILDELNESHFSLTKSIIKKPFLNSTEITKLKLKISEDNIKYIEDLLKENRSQTEKKIDVGFNNTVNRLLELRNDIVHGNKNRRLSKMELVEMKDEIFLLIELLYSSIDKYLDKYRLLIVFRP